MAAARLRPPDAFELLGYEPEPAQAVFHAATEFDVGYGGRAGGGKTLALLAEAIRWCHRIPRFRAVGFRRTYPEVQESFGKELGALDFARAVGANYMAGPPPQLRFPNGSVIDFRYAENVQDASRVIGGAMQLCMIDERQLIPQDLVQVLRSRIRSERGVPVVGIRSTFNPGDIGHAYLKARYVDGTGNGQHTYPEVVDGKPTGLMIRFIPAPPTRHLPPEYWSQTLAGIEDPWLRRALQTGDWDIVPGSSFPEWRRDTHVVDPEDLPIPDGVPRGRGVDYGLAHPFSCHWGAVLSDGLVVVYREIVQAGLTPTEQAELIMASETDEERAGKHPTWLDPSTWKREPYSPGRPSRHTPPILSVADGYVKAGLPVEKAFNDRIAGKRLIHDGLKVQADGMARIVVYSTCSELIRTLPALPRSKSNPEDVAKMDGDDAYDSFRYLIAGLKRVPGPATTNARQVRSAVLPSAAGRSGFA